MASRAVGVADAAPGVAVAQVDTLERGSPDLITTTTADPGSGGTTLAVTSASRFPATNNYTVRVENEVMLVTAGAGTTSWTVTRGYDNTTAVAHTSGVTVALVVTVQRVSPIIEQNVSYQGQVATFRTPGRAAVAQNLFSLFNASGSTILVAVRELTIESDATAVLTAVAALGKTARSTALPTNGTALTKVAADTDQASSSSVTVIGDASADGTSSGTTLTSTPGVAFCARYVMRMHTAVGEIISPPESLLPEIADTDPIILRASQGLLVHIVAAATTSNPTTNHYVVNCVWEEFTIQ